MPTLPESPSPVCPEPTEAEWADYAAYLDSGRPMGGYYPGWDAPGDPGYEPPSEADQAWWAAASAEGGAE